MDNYYKKLTPEILEEIMLTIKDDSDNEFVVYFFGTEEQIENIQKELDDVILKEIKN